VSGASDAGGGSVRSPVGRECDCRSAGRQEDSGAPDPFGDGSGSGQAGGPGFGNSRIDSQGLGGTWNRRRLEGAGGDPGTVGADLRFVCGNSDEAASSGGPPRRLSG